MMLCWGVTIGAGILFGIIGYFLGKLWPTDTEKWEKECEEILVKLEECKKQSRRREDIL